VAVTVSTASVAGSLAVQPIILHRLKSARRIPGVNATLYADVSALIILSA
jgi:hypothetical protein